jgi:hypothetical protein
VPENKAVYRAKSPLFNDSEIDLISIGSKRTRNHDESDDQDNDDTFIELSSPYKKKRVMISESAANQENAEDTKNLQMFVAELIRHAYFKKFTKFTLRDPGLLRFIWTARDDFSYFENLLNV